MTALRTIKSWVAAALMAVACASAPAQTCTVSSSGMAFGNLNPLSGGPWYNTGSVSVTCQAVVALLVSYTVKATAGGGSSFAGRRMSGPALLPYQVYTDATYTSVWGDGTSSTGYFIGGYLLAVLVPVTTNYTVYGRVPAQPTAMPGAYTDTLTVLVTY